MDNYIFELSDKVTRTTVSYPNRFGINLDADLYLPKEFDASQQHHAILVGGPYGGTKEQAPGIYAQTMAERGFVALAFDPSFYGYSGGHPRFVSSPEIYVEDFSAGVDYLGTREFVNKNQIAAIGVCGSGGFALSAAQIDPRIKAVVTTSMYDISRYIRNGLGDTQTEEQRKQLLNEIAEQRYEDFKTGRPVLESRSMQLSALTEENPTPVAKEFADFYLQPRGYHHNALAQHTMSSMPAFMNFSLLNHVDDIAPRPILLIAGENAHSRYFSEDVYKQAKDPRELFIVPGANHVDLYDKVDLIPFDKITEFLTKNV
ncbi:alpha/beta hydrolase [Companilactobacillus futsaii]|uniref:Alpha/beta hydrolase n=2 Tax=Companilactobacillus futsaii TaxID=938155 RepID=A0A5B7T1V9_9LACO|nr:alpha/beta hydrolase [Companilactobacillus futsaii]KRK99384.1 alpha beta fold family hydrolase-like protein [Companilactobacillus futsaii JCM 17355]QCX24171.1 alpha/beta hydrolase [Companilactobacillus futsaii]